MAATHPTQVQLLPACPLSCVIRPAAKMPVFQTGDAGAAPAWRTTFNAHVAQQGEARRRERRQCRCKSCRGHQLSTWHGEDSNPLALEVRDTRGSTGVPDQSTRRGLRLKAGHLSYKEDAGEHYLQPLPCGIRPTARCGHAKPETPVRLRNAAPFSQCPMFPYRCSKPLASKQGGREPRGATPPSGTNFQVLCDRDRNALLS